MLDLDLKKGAFFEKAPFFYLFFFFRSFKFFKAGGCA
jgi:hypothetical protein